MKTTPLSLLLATLLTLPLATLAAEPHDHGHGHDAPQALTLNAGQKWATDAPLRQGMSQIRAAVARTLPAAHAGKAKPADYQALSQTVNRQVGDIVANCKLTPEADAQLHLVIADLMSGAEAAEGKEGAKQRAAGVVRMGEALNAYGAHFDHPGWKAIALPH